MLYSKIKNFLWENKFTILLICSLFFYTTDAWADNTGTYGALFKAGSTIFIGLRKVIYPAATIGVACVCIAGMFGSFNWKWLVAILLGVFIIAFAEQVGGVAVGQDKISLDGSS